MGAEVFQLVAVTVGLICLVVLPFVPIAYSLMPAGPWPRLVLAALVIGTSLQSVLGMLWSHIVGKGPYGEIVVGALLWLSMLVWSRWRAHARRDAEPRETKGESLQVPLMLMLCAAFLVRSIHPLQVAYLGQSDAYTHLHYLRNIIDQGKLINPIYPPGYHWILALPARVFNIDPYVMARYAGAFFGTGLVLSIYVLLDRLFNRRAAILGSFFAACFPLMTLLLKTGVGAFPNQFGIMLIPVIMLSYWNVVAGKNKPRLMRGLFPLALGGMAAAVPIMLLHILVVVGLERLLMLFRTPSRWFATTARVTLLVVPAVALLVFHVSQAGPKPRAETASILVGYGSTHTPGTQTNAAHAEVTPTGAPAGRGISLSIMDGAVCQLVRNYVAVKRRDGLGNAYLNGSLLLLASLFFGCIVLGTARAKQNVLLIGLWGFVTSVQTSTGLLQLSAYQREGWSLLVATCCLAGILAGWVFDKGSRSRLFRAAVAAGMGATFVWALWQPPQHPALKSGAEGLVVRAVRFFGRPPEMQAKMCDADEEGPFCTVAGMLNAEQPLTLVTRRFSSWRRQDEIGPNVLQRNSPLHLAVVSDRGSLPSFESPNQYVVLVDRQEGVDGRRAVSASAMVTPALVEETLKQQEQLYEVNALLVDWVNDLRRDQWLVSHVELSASLSASVVVPVEARKR